MKDLICSIDVGTTSTKVALVDEGGAVVAIASAPTPVDLDRQLAVDPEALLTTVLGLVRELVGQRDASGVAALAVTNQRATVLALDEADRPLAASSWQDPGVEDARVELTTRIDQERFRTITGLPHSTIWSLTKIHWWRRRAPEVAGRAARYALVHDDLLCRLGATEPLIDPSNASPTGMWDLKQQRWSAELLALVDLTEERLPRVVPAGTVAGRLGAAPAREMGLLESTPLVVAGGDQACATLGLGVLEPGQVALSLGTSADVLSPLAGAAAPHPARINTAHVVAEQTLLEGFLGAFGPSLAWAGSLGPALDDAWTVGAGTPYFVPFLDGVASPDFEPRARGGLLGLDPSHGAEELALAVRDGLAMELRRILESPATVDGVSELVVAGGGAREPALLRHIADVTGVRLVARPGREATVIGAAAVALAGLGRHDSPLSAARAFASGDETRWEPRDRAALLEGRYAQYLRWVEAVLIGSRS